MDRLRLVDRYGVVCNPGEPYVAQYPWVNLGSIASGDVTTTPAVGARDRTSMLALVTAGNALQLLPPMEVEVNEGTGYVPNGAEAYKLRFRSTGTNNGSHVVDIFSCANPIASEFYTRRARLTTLQGTQVHTAGSIYFHDTITETLEAWTTDETVIQPTSPTNEIAEFAFNVHGDVSFIIVGITIPSGTLYIDARRFT